MLGFFLLTKLNKLDDTAFVKVLHLCREFLPFAQA